MTLPFPDRIPTRIAFMTGALLAGVLFAEGNPIAPCLCIFALVLVGIYGFNQAGGFRHPTGSYVFFVVLFTGLLGSIVKAATNEPLLDNVPNADQTLLVYLAGSCAMVMAAVLSRRFIARKPLLVGRLTQANSGQVVVGCVVIGITLPIAAYLISPSVGTIARQLNIALPLAVLIGVYQKTRATGGRSSFSWPVLIAWGYFTWLGLMSYSKENMFTPSLAWVVAAAAGRLRVSVLQIIIAVPTAILAIMVLVPYSQYGRNFRNSPDPNLPYKLLRHPLELREKVNAAQEMEEDIYHWYNKPRGILDRLTLVPIDSALIRRTDLVGPIGLENTFLYFENIIPHFILPDKPDVHSGNDYAHEIGMLAGNDLTTGISFSPFADAYHQAGWLGVLILMPAVQLLLFTVIGSVTGSSDESPWALFFIMAYGHLAAEGLMLFPVYIMSVGAEAIIAMAFVMIHVTPLIGTLLLGPGRRGAVSQAPVRAHMRNVPSAAGS